MDFTSCSCPHCGVDLPSPETARCPECGCQVRQSAAASKGPPPLPAAPESFEDLAGEPAPKRPTRRKPAARSSSKALVWALAAGGAALLLGLVVLVVTVAMAPEPQRKERPSASGNDAVKKITDYSRARTARTGKEEPKAKEPARQARAIAKEKEDDPPPPAKEEKEDTALLTFDDWPQDLADAKRLAAASSKDLLLVFVGSDWDGPSKRLIRQVLLTPTFRRRAGEQFVPVLLDFPKGDEAKAKVQDAARNDRVRKQYGIDAQPYFLLADAEGRPYAVTVYEDGGPESFCPYLGKLQEARITRDRLLEAVAEAKKGPDKLKAARDVLMLLTRLEMQSAGAYEVKTLDFLGNYASLLDQWVQLSAEHDPSNKRGEAEFFFFMSCYAQLRRAAVADPKGLEATLARLEEWRKKNKVKDADNVAMVYLNAGIYLSLAGRAEQAARCFKAGLDCKPPNEELAKDLADCAAGRKVLGSGTGFAVADGGYLVTNHHVVTGPGRVMVLLKAKDGKGAGSAVLARVVEKDEGRDIALLKVELPAGVKLPPLVVSASKELRRGAQVHVFGFPLVASLGSGIKMTSGKVNGLPEPAEGNMIVTDARVNPGNSGGPLCDARGNVVGLVTAKTRSGPTADSFGLAVPAADVEAFLKKHLGGYKPAQAREKELKDEEVDPVVSPAVVRVLKVL